MPDTMSDMELRLLDTRAKLFDAVLRLWAHQDAYVWNRARLIVGVQGGVFAGAFAVGAARPWLVALVLCSGALLTGVLQWMVRADQRARDSYYQYLDPLASSLFGPPLYTEALSFRIIPQPSPQKGARFRVSTLLQATFALLVVVDLTCAGFMLYAASR